MSVNGGAKANIERLAAAFYAEFDNRNGRIPRVRVLLDMFFSEARIVRLDQDGALALDRVTFLEPRIELLSTGALTQFHEWEIEGQTIVMGNIATRTSVYRKEGVMNGQPYVGSGRKLLHLFNQDGRWLIAAMLWEDD